jgi:hypothetical protein
MIGHPFYIVNEGRRRCAPQQNRALDFRLGSFATKIDHSGHFRLSPKSGSTADIADGPVRADTVEKVENRTTPKISQMLIFGQLRR